MKFRITCTDLVLTPLIAGLLCKYCKVTCVKANEALGEKWYVVEFQTIESMLTDSDAFVQKLKQQIINVIQTDHRPDIYRPSVMYM